jgi:hypothetical protein
VFQSTESDISEYTLSKATCVPAQGAIFYVPAAASMQIIVVQNITNVHPEYGSTKSYETPALIRLYVTS